MPEKRAVCHDRIAPIASISMSVPIGSALTPMHDLAGGGFGIILMYASLISLNLE